MKAELKPYQLGRRLGSGVKMIFLKSGDVRELTGIDITEEEIRYHFGIISRGSIIWNYKPILRPLSHLTIPITHNGETFVPMDVLYDKWKLRMGGLSKLGILNAINENAILYLPMFYCELLIQWRFVLDEPQGTWISVDDLDTNPYEN